MVRDAMTRICGCRFFSGLPIYTFLGDDHLDHVNHTGLWSTDAPIRSSWITNDASGLAQPQQRETPTQKSIQ